MANQKLTPEIESVLRAARIDGNKLYLTGQLDRKTYQEVAKFLENCGFTWSRKDKAHVSQSDPKKLLFAAEEGEAVDEQKKFQSFYTPQWLVEKIVALADVKGKTVLEPSCGDGRIIVECLKRGACWIDGVELNKEAHKETQTLINKLIPLLVLEKGTDGDVPVHLANADFLEWPLSVNLDGQVTGYEVVIGNPPYKNTTWLKHTLHAYKFVKLGGKLVFILPNSIHSNKKFQDFVSDKRWECEKVEAGAFKDEGTSIETNVVTIWK